ncbi:MAG: hypothetical protein SA339_11970 [Methanomassiliicoccus sp.]|nr:hypothetical protein [Methanomassiliicoccus sp.]
MKLSKLASVIEAVGVHKVRIRKMHCAFCHDEERKCHCSRYNGHWDRCTKRRFAGREETKVPCPDFIRRPDGQVFEPVGDE